MTKRLVSAILLVAAVVTPSAEAVQIALTPANVIGGSGSYPGVAFNSGQFNAGLILDKQTGAMGEANQVGGDADGGYWLNADGGPAAAYIVIDLGAAYQLDEVELFNTHNAQFNDRGTGRFSITGGNAVTNLGAAGFDLTGSTTLLVLDNLAPEVQANDPLNAQAFNITDAGSYRYLRFAPLTVASGGAPCCGANNYGLNEIRFFSTALPEPSVVAMGMIGAASLLMGRRRRA